MTGMEARLDRMEAEMEITRKLHLYARGCDRADVEILRSVYHRDAVEEHGIYSGPAYEFCDMAVEVARSAEALTHHISNILIDLGPDRDEARSECCFHAVSVGFRDEDKAPRNLIMVGRYLDRFERRDGEWKIAFRQMVMDWHAWADHNADWTTGVAAAFSERGRADREDYLYRFLASRDSPADRVRPASPAAA